MRLAGVVIHIGADFGIISDDANGGRRYKFRVKDVRAPGAPPSARPDEAAARAAFSAIKVSSGQSEVCPGGGQQAHLPPPLLPCAAQGRRCVCTPAGGKRGRLGRDGGS